MKQKNVFYVLLVLLTAGLIAINWDTVRAAIARISGPGTGGKDAPPDKNPTAPAPTVVNGMPVVPVNHISAKGYGAAAAGLNYNIVLQQGMKGAEVKALQKMLNIWNPPIAEDGAFGPLTENKLAQYGSTKSISLTAAANLYHRMTGLYYTF